MMRSITILSLIALLAGLFALAIGSVTIAPAELWQVVQGEGSTLHRTLVFELRLPRTLAAFATGGLLAVAGALMQFAALNPVDEWLAEYMEVPRRDAQVDEMDTDTDLEYGGRMAGW